MVDSLYAGDDLEDQLNVHMDHITDWCMFSLFECNTYTPTRFRNYISQ